MTFNNNFLVLFGGKEDFPVIPALDVEVKRPGGVQGHLRTSGELEASLNPISN